MDAVPQADAVLQEIIDHHQIRKLLSAYCHGCDRADWERMRSVYGTDSWDDHGIYKGSGQNFPEYVKAGNEADGTQTTHLLGQSQIRVDGDRAGAETYFLAVVSKQNSALGEPMTLLGGRYVDLLLRREGGWLIEKRDCVRDWSITLEVGQDPLRDYGFIQGMFSNEDVSYAALGLRHSGRPKGPDAP